MGMPLELTSEFSPSVSFNTSFNPYVTNGFSHPYYLDECTFIGAILFAYVP